MNSLIFHVPTVVFSFSIGQYFSAGQRSAPPKPRGPVFHRHNGWRGGIYGISKAMPGYLQLGFLLEYTSYKLHSNQYKQLGRTLGAPKVETKSAHKLSQNTDFHWFSLNLGDLPSGLLWCSVFVWTQWFQLCVVFFLRGKFQTFFSLHNFVL